MLKLVLGLMVIIASLMVITTASADGRPPAEQQKYVQGLDHPAQLPPAYGNSVVAVNYDIHYDGNTCFRWLNEWLPVTIVNPTVITFTNPVDDFDLVHVIACEAY